MSLDGLLSDAPPRYAYESDSSDSDFDDPDVGDPAAARRPPKRPRPATPTVDVQWSGETDRELFVQIGEGAAWSRGVPLLEVRGSITVDGRQVASICQTETANVVLLASTLPLPIQTAVGKRLITVIRPSRLQVIDVYSWQKYLPSATDREGPALRFLQTTDVLRQSDGLFRLFDVPNLVVGISAALMLEASRLTLAAILILVPTLASAASFDTAITEARLRPVGIYDPYSAGPGDMAGEMEAAYRLLSEIPAVQRHALGWTQLRWRAEAPIESTSPLDAWSWSRHQDRIRGRSHKDVGDLYL